MRRRAFLSAASSAALGAFAPFGAIRSARASAKKAPRPATAIAELNERIPKLMHDMNVPGVSIVLVRDAQIVWHREFGVADAASGVPVDRNTVFEAQSMSK